MAVFFYYKKFKCNNLVREKDHDDVCVNEYNAFETYLFVIVFVFLKKTCRSNCGKPTGTDCSIIGLWLPFSLKSFTNENKAELGVIAHCPQALVSKPPLVIWRMQNIFLSYIAL